MSSAFFFVAYFPYGDPFPLMKIPNISKMWLRLMDFGIFLHPHSKILGIWTIPLHTIFMFSFLTLCTSFNNNYAPATKLDPDL